MTKIIPTKGMIKYAIQTWNSRIYVTRFMARCIIIALKP